jgi:outer membrane receptor for ferric coprogen and ferric-rhodotorulic acid
LPTDIWFPTTDIAKPQKGSQTTIGLFKNWFDDKLETSVELYYKSIQNLIEYKPGALPSDNISDNVDNVLVFGSGISKGIEFFIKKTTGKWTGWLGYTLAKSDRYFPDIQKERFPSKYDRRHDFTFVSNFKISDRLTLGSVFVFATGNTMTLPSSWYIQEQTILFDYFSRNSTRMPAYQRLDLSLTLYDKPTKKKYITSAGESMEVPKRFRSNWNFSVYNVYNYANPFFIYLSGQGFALQGTFRLSLKQVTLFPIIPSITWNFSF